MHGHLNVKPNLFFCKLKNTSIFPFHWQNLITTNAVTVSRM